MGFFRSYFGSLSVSFDDNLYACMIAQALHLSGTVASEASPSLMCCVLFAHIYTRAYTAYRGGNWWGLQTWQLNEIWPTGGWGAVETGAYVTGSNLVG